MPVLHKYNKSYHKSGYYVKVNWSAPHPYPLQTPAITEKIYLELGFEPNDDVPNELTSRLFNAGLHWTEGNGSADPEKQTVENSITDASLPALSQEQLDRLYELLDDAETEIHEIDTKPGALGELRSELRKLQDGNSDDETDVDQSAIPDETITYLRDLIDENLSSDKAAKMRTSSTDPIAFDHILKQLTRYHLITPHGFELNEYNDPTFKFRTGSIYWKLADCRAKELDFDWAVTIAPQTDRVFEIRVRSNELVRAVFDGSELSEQQATDLINIIPCLLWSLDYLDNYQLSPQWGVSLLESDIPESEFNLLVDQTEAALQALESSISSEEGVIIDLPESQFSRIRNPESRILCTPVASLPEEAKRGSVVKFDVDRRYGTDYAKNISVAEFDDEIWTNIQDLQTEIRMRILEGFDSRDFPICLQPVNKNELTVDVDHTKKEDRADLLELQIEHFVDSNDHWGYFKVEVHIDERDGLHRISVTTDLGTSWEVKGCIYKLLGNYLPVIATALDHKGIDLGRYDDSVPIEFTHL